MPEKENQDMPKVDPTRSKIEDEGADESDTVSLPDGEGDVEDQIKPSKTGDIDELDDDDDDENDAITSRQPRLSDADPHG